MCGSSSTSSISAHLASGIPTRLGTTVKHATWSTTMQQWQLAGTTGVHKDAARTDAKPSDALEELGSYDALVVADAAVMRQGSAGFINFEADSPGWLPTLALSHEPMHALLLHYVLMHASVCVVL
jgi:hypothetical protein